jgi:hypothetical protein
VPARAALGRSAGSPGPGRVCLEIGGVDVDERLPSAHFLVIVDQHTRDAAGNLRADLYHVHIDERVIGGDPFACLEPPGRAAANDRNREQHGSPD